MVERAAAVGPRRAAWRQQRREGQWAGIEGGHHVGMHAAHAQPAHPCRRGFRGGRGAVKVATASAQCTAGNGRQRLSENSRGCAGSSSNSNAAAHAAPGGRVGHMQATCRPRGLASAAGAGSPRWWPSPAAAGLTHAAAWTPAGSAAFSDRRRGFPAPAWQCPAGWAWQIARQFRVAVGTTGAGKERVVVSGRCSCHWLPAPAAHPSPAQPSPAQFPPLPPASPGAGPGGCAARSRDPRWPPGAPRRGRPLRAGLAG